MNFYSDEEYMTDQEIEILKNIISNTAKLEEMVKFQK